MPLSFSFELHKTSAIVTAAVRTLFFFDLWHVLMLTRGFGVLLFQSQPMQTVSCGFCLWFQWLIKKIPCKGLPGKMQAWLQRHQTGNIVLFSGGTLYSDPRGFVTGLGLFNWKINIFCLCTRNVSLAFLGSCSSSHVFLRNLTAEDVLEANSNPCALLLAITSWSAGNSRRWN